LIERRKIALIAPTSQGEREGKMNEIEEVGGNPGQVDK